MITETRPVIIRMRDVGIALLASGSFGEPLNRLRLQKFVYLLDQVGQLLRVLPPALAHYSFRNGPFDPRIQNAVDSLAFRGLVDIQSLHQARGGSIHCEYTLSVPGLGWAERMSQHPLFSDRSRAAQLIASEVNRIGWGRLRELVYAEPTYLAVRPNGYGEQLRSLQSTDPSSAAIFKGISKSLASGFKKKPTVDLVVELYFEYLKSYATAESKYTT